MTRWDKSAECATVETSVFFDPGHERLARAICADCPVREACLAAALTEERGMGLHARHGIRGGKTPAERLAGHGTAAAYKRGCRCEPCRSLKASYSRTSRSRAAGGGA